VIGITVDGGLAEYVSAPHVSLHRVPDNVNLENAVFAEPMSCVLDAFVSAGELYGKNVLIAGAGPAGLLFCILAKHFGANTIISTDISQHRVDKALEFGADHSVVSRNGDFPIEVNSLCDEIDIVFDTVGTLVEGALNIVGRGGRVIIYGLDQNAKILISPFDIVMNKKQVLGGFANSQLMWRVSNILAKVDLNKLITHRVGLDDMSLEGLARINSDTVLKMVVYPNE
jgi:(R,R)-butanediol dehydrogenase/meso-butanediol dehydrogenase/diacetyl reductase